MKNKFALLLFFLLPFWASAQVDTLGNILRFTGLDTTEILVLYVVNPGTGESQTFRCNREEKKTIYQVPGTRSILEQSEHRFWIDTETHPLFLDPRRVLAEFPLNYFKTEKP